MYQNDALKCLTGECRLSYAHLTAPYAWDPKDPERYSVTLLIPKADGNTKADLDNAISAAMEKGIQDKWGGVRPPVLPELIHDGDGVRQDGSPYAPECKGHWVLTASSNADHRPQVVHISNVNAELLPGDIYSGMYARVTLRFFPYAAKGKKGVGCGLNNVCKTRDGERLGGGGATAASDFAGIAEAATRVDPLTGEVIK